MGQASRAEHPPPTRRLGPRFSACPGWPPTRCPGARAVPSARSAIRAPRGPSRLGLGSGTPSGAPASPASTSFQPPGLMSVVHGALAIQRAVKPQRYSSFRWEVGPFRREVGGNRPAGGSWEVGGRFVGARPAGLQAPRLSFFIICVLIGVPQSAPSPGRLVSPPVQIGSAGPWWDNPSAPGPPVSAPRSDVVARAGSPPGLRQVSSGRMGPESESRNGRGTPSGSPPTDPRGSPSPIARSSVHTSFPPHLQGPRESRTARAIPRRWPPFRGRDPGGAPREESGSNPGGQSRGWPGTAFSWGRTPAGRRSFLRAEGVPFEDGLEANYLRPLLQPSRT